MKPNNLILFLSYLPRQTRGLLTDAALAHSPAAPPDTRLLSKKAILR